MKKIKKQIKEFFSISEKEANGFLLLSFFILLLLIFPWAYDYYLQRFVYEPPAEKDFTFEVLSAHETAKSFYTDSALKAFNPNNFTAESWEAVGVSHEIAARIDKYKAKGGRFIVKSDLKKIYGFPEDMYYRLHEYILLPDSVSSPPQIHKTKEKSEKSKPLDLNTATTDDLEALPGIGPVLAERIIRFRNILGGFVNKNQLFEVYGLDSLTAETLQEKAMVSSTFTPEKIDINISSAEKLSKHPYVSRKAAEILVNYRNQHGSYKSWEDLLQSKALDEKKLKLLLPYLKFQ